MGQEESIGNSESARSCSARHEEGKAFSSPFARGEAWPAKGEEFVEETYVAFAGLRNSPDEVPGKLPPFRKLESP